MDNPYEIISETVDAPDLNSLEVKPGSLSRIQKMVIIEGKSISDETAEELLSQAHWVASKRMGSTRAVRGKKNWRGELHTSYLLYDREGKLMGRLNRYDIELKSRSAPEPIGRNYWFPRRDSVQ